LPPVLLKPECVGWALASLTACKAAASGMCRFNSCPAHLRTRPVRLTAGCEPLKLAIRVPVPDGALKQASGETGYARRSERRAHWGMRVRLSPWLLTLQVWQAPSRVS